MAYAFRSPNFILPKFLLPSFYIINIIQKSILWLFRSLGVPSTYCVDYDVDNNIGATEQLNESPHLVVAVESICEILPVLKYGDYLVNSSTKDCCSSQEDEEMSCAVCLCKFEREDEIRMLMICPHIFHRTCLDSWMDLGSNNTTCPYCRTPLVSPKLVMTENSCTQNTNPIRVFLLES